MSKNSQTETGTFSRSGCFHTPGKFEEFLVSKKTPRFNNAPSCFSLNFVISGTSKYIVILFWEPVEMLAYLVMTDPNINSRLSTGDFVLISSLEKPGKQLLLHLEGWNTCLESHSQNMEFNPILDLRAFFKFPYTIWYPVNALEISLCFLASVFNPVLTK